MATIIKFPMAVRAEQAAVAAETAVRIQLVQLQRTVDSWRQIVRQLDLLAQSDDMGALSEQSRHIRQLIADAERAIAHVQAIEDDEIIERPAPD